MMLVLMMRRMMMSSNYNELTGVNFSTLKLMDIHPKVYKDAIDNPKEKDTSAMLFGSTFHKYMENPEAFAVLEIDKPGGEKGNIAEYVVNFESIAYENNADEILLAVARKNGWNPKWGDDAVIKNLQDCKPFINSYIQNKDKVILTAAVKAILEKCIGSYKGEVGVQKKVRLLEESAEEIHTEFVVQDSHTISLGEKDITTSRKGKLDKVYINHTKKEIVIKDYKTTSGFADKYVEYIDVNGQIKKGPFYYYHTDAQLAYYESILKTSYPDYKITCMVVAVMTVFPYNCYLFTLTDNVSGRVKIHNWLNELVRCTRDNDFRSIPEIKHENCFEIIT